MSLAVLIVLAPLCLMIALAIRIDSAGPSIFRQERLGLRGRPFVLFKYRTMRVNADSGPHRRYVQELINGPSSGGTGNLYKLVIDPRITRIGRRLRRWSLDELPQLVNVLRGDMALVGPRPVISYEAELYQASQLERFSEKPGLTGLWQVSGRNARTYHEMLALDLEYVRRRSLKLDLLILIKTVPVILKRKGVA